MKYIVKNVLIIDKRSPHYHKKLDIEIDNGKITRVAKNLNASDGQKEIKGKELILTTSFVDLNANSGEPNRLEAETMDSLLGAAAKGGYSHICHMPGEGKHIQNKSDVAYLQSKNSKNICQVLPIGNITKGDNENVISSMMEMKQAGAIAFSDGNEYTPGLSVLKNALLYSKGFDSKLLIHPEKKVLSKKGFVNQGFMSIMLGYKGIPKEAEIMAVAEIIQLANYTGTKVLIINVTCPESLKLITEANRQAKHIFSAISSLHLSLNEEKLLEYDTNFKLNPPLRSKKDQKAMIKAALQGKIDIVFSQHTPCTSEEKILEFDLASYGAINLQTSAVACIEALGIEQIERCTELLSTAPANFLGIELPVFEVGAIGSFTILDMKTGFEWKQSDNKSKSQNSPYFGHKFNCKVMGIISNQMQEFFIH